MACPNCGSNNISFKRESAGEIRGSRAKQVVHRTVGFCKDCGHTWVTSMDEVSVPKKRRTWLWVLGWLFIFPLPLTILIVRNKTMKPIVKYLIIGAAWLLYFGIASTSNKEASGTTPTNSSVNEQTATGNTEDKIINVQFEVTPKVNSDDGSVLFGIKTNLPENTELLVTVTDDNGYAGQDKAVILKDGNGYTAEFSNHGEALKGMYHVEITMSLPALQANSVREVIGEHGENLTGEYVIKSDVTNDNLIKGKFDFEF